jgi:type VI secretion system secreted protein VgrG
MADRLLNLVYLAGEDVDEYRLVRFEGREAICEPFEYALELVTARAPKLGDWIGKPVEFFVAPGHDERRRFAGQIHEATDLGGGVDHRRMEIRVRPVFFGTAFARGISFFQDKNSVQILEELTKTLPGFVLDKGQAGSPPKRAYAVKYDETEFEFLTRLLAQDGILYFFKHDKTAGNFRHKMVLANSAGAYLEIKNASKIDFGLANDRNSVTALQHSYHSFAHLHGYGGAIINGLNTLAHENKALRPLWGKTFDSRHQEIAGGVANTAELAERTRVATERHEQESELISGTSSLPQLCAAGRMPNAPGERPRKLVLTSVIHSCSEPLREKDAGYYRNSFTAIDANRTFRAPVPTTRRRAPGPIVGIVSKKDAKEGQIEVDNQARVPVWITHGHPRATLIWLPVQQAWSQASYGTQFIPRIGTQVLIDFLYGDPDLPFVSGCFYTPSQKYPFDLPAKSTRSGWRSKTEKNGAIVQELMFEDKAGGEEIHMYTGRNYRRQIDKDELATINANNVKLVKQNQSLTVKGKRDSTIEKTQTVTVFEKALFESKKEIEIKVGPSTIRLTLQGIEIKAPKITVKADTTIDVKAGAKMAQQAPMVEVKGDAVVVIKGGIVKIN